MTKNTQKIFFLFLLVHLLVWTLIPYLSNKNLPLDTIEALAWGSNLDWGFNKHPPLSAFSVEIIYQIFGSRDWAYYLLSQIYVCFAFFIIWRFSKDFFKNHIYSLISILLLEGIYFYNYTTPEFNVYICAIPFWSLSVLFCWKGFKDNKSTDWLLFGFFAGLGVLSHYLFLYLLVAMDVFFIYMLINKKINFKCLISLITFFLVLSPHLIWLTENEYVTFTYALHRTGLEESNFLNHITYPFVFLAKQTGIFLPFFVMFLAVISKLKTKLNLKDKKLLFLLNVNIIPIVLVFLTSMLLGIKIRTMWMTPFYMFFGVLLLYIFQKQVNLKKVKNFFSVFIIIFILSPAIYLYISITKTNKRTDYPGKEIALLVEKRWSNNFNNQINYVVGDEWHAGNLSYHLESRPKWFNTLDKEIEKIDFQGGFIYTGNAKVLKEICPGIFGSIKSQGICMIGSK